MIFLYASPSLEGKFFDIFDATDSSFYGLVGRHYCCFHYSYILILNLIQV